MPHRQGDRVEYRNQMNEKQQGRIEEVQGSGPQARYTVKNEKSQQKESIQEQQIERDLQ